MILPPRSFVIANNIYSGGPALFLLRCHFYANRGLFLDHPDKELQPMAFIAIDLVLQQCRLIPPAIKPFFSIDIKYVLRPVVEIDVFKGIIPERNYGAKGVYVCYNVNPLKQLHI